MFDGWHNADVNTEVMTNVVCCNGVFDVLSETMSDKSMEQL
jgi:hypothetical protein